MPTRPHHLDHAKAQFLLVGESSGLDKAMEPQKKAQKDADEEPLDELEKLEDEDARRMQALEGDDSDAIFADLQGRAEDYPRLKTTF
jgi:hypothetical protein